VLLSFAGLSRAVTPGLPEAIKPAFAAGLRDARTVDPVPVDDDPGATR